MYYCPLILFEQFYDPFLIGPKRALESSDWTGLCQIWLSNYWQSDGGQSQQIITTSNRKWSNISRYHTETAALTSDSNERLLQRFLANKETKVLSRIATITSGQSNKVNKQLHYTHTHNKSKLNDYVYFIIIPDLSFRYRVSRSMWPQEWGSYRNVFGL